MEERIIRVAILGQGRSGRDIHAKYLMKATNKYKIIAVSDTLPERRKRAEEELGCQAYSDYREIFKRDDIDLFINALPSHLHVPVTKEILNAGFHVLCDKPLARKVKEVDMLIKAAEKSGKILAVFQQSRYSPAFQQIKKIINSGVLGRIVQISIAYNGFSRRWDWQTLQEFYGGSLLNTGPHPLDQIIDLLNSEKIPEVFCIMDRVNTYGDAEDYVKLILRLPEKPVVDLEISCCDAYPTFTYHIQAKNGGLKGDLKRLEWKYYKPEEAPERKLQTTPIENPDGTPAYCGEKLKFYEEHWELSEEQKDMLMYMVGCFYNMLYDTLVYGKPLEITLQQVRQQIAVIEKCQKQNPQIYGKPKK
ncbi:MAG: Gfo/Idh/MocA family oxidoreductase [Candidatus Omnitrophica bacterium]|nr:Gfo/Idh/MocA family oxidoreductase [Candidatus Omnitrophota bacterium]